MPRITIADLDPLTRPTLDIPEAGALFGLGRAQSYNAANSGHLPTVQISERRRVVPTAALRRMLALDESDGAA